VKTVEAPRDLVLPENITQYAISHGDAQEVHDILLLSRPDYTIFDEMRNTDDFKLFADMRLAGVGMVGVVHATNPVDAIQRFIGRVEMGVIPQIIDTVVFIKNGAIQNVLGLKMVVKVPSGMTEADLARPVVIITDFESGKLMYEIYSYGEQTVVVPVQEEISKSGVHKLAEENISRELMKYADNVKVNCVSDNKCVVKVPERNIARIIGKEGKTINEIEKKLGMGIDVQALEVKSESDNTQKSSVPYEVIIKKNSIMFQTGIKMQNKDIDVYVKNEFILTAKAGKTGIIKVKKNNALGRMLIKAYNSGEEIKLFA
jgi:ATPase